MKCEEATTDLEGISGGLLKKLVGYLANRLHLYNFLRNVKDFYLPKVETCSIQFLLKLFTAESKAVSSKAVDSLGRKPALKVRRADLIRLFETKEHLRPYLPICTYIEKEYLVTQLAVLDQVLYNELSLRHSSKTKEKPLEKKKQLYIYVQPEFAESLLRMPPKPNQPVLTHLMVLKSPYSTPNKSGSKESTPKKPTSQLKTEARQGEPRKRVKIDC